MLQLEEDLGLEAGELGESEGVGLCDDGDQVDLLVELPHGGHVQHSEPMAPRRDEVEAAVDTIVHYGLAMKTALVLEVFLELNVDVIRKGLCRILRVDGIPETYLSKNEDFRYFTSCSLCGFNDTARNESLNNPKRIVKAN